MKQAANAPVAPPQQPAGQTPPETPEAVIPSAVVLIPVKLFERMRYRGQVLAPELVARLSPKQRTVLVNQGILALHEGEPPPPAPEPEEIAAARAALARSEELAEGLRARLAALEGSIAANADKRSALVLAAATGDASAKATLETLRQAHAVAPLEAEDLRAALASSTRRSDEAKDTLAKAERARLRDEAERLAEQRLASVGEIERLATELARHVAAYTRLGHQIAHVTGNTGGQLASAWRLESVLNERLGLAPVDPAMRVPDLAALEKRILDNIITRGFRDGHRP